MNMPDMLIITRGDIVRVMRPHDWLAAAEAAFRAAAAGSAHSPAPMHIPVAGGGFHAKGASFTNGRAYVAVKVNGNFPGNMAAHGLPTVQGAIILADGANGALLAVLDSTEVTLRRTAAASALAARLLARSKSETLLVCGCGSQGRAHVEAFRQVLPLRRFLFWDRQADAAECLAQAAGGTAVADLNGASLAADVIACCTSAGEPFLKRGMVRRGTFVAAVGADSPDKSEIDPTLMAASVVVTDVLAQCMVMGDLRHAVGAGLRAETVVRADLAAIVADASPGRLSDDEIIVFDSTGAGFQDVAASAAIYERCVVGMSTATVALAGES